MQIVIPARNEADRLPRTLAALRAHVLGAGESPAALEVIVVDNGSTDGTARLALMASSPIMPVRVVECAERGKGAAVRAGIASTTADIVGFMDADGATRLDALMDAFRVIESGADVAVGSRAVPGSVTTERHSAVRVLGARVYRASTHRLAPGISDTQCGFKVFRGDLARSIFSSLRTTGFSFDVEILSRAQRRGARVVEFPVFWDDVPGSTFQPFRHGVAAFWELATIAVHLRRSPGTTEQLPVVAPVPLAPAVEG